MRTSLRIGLESFSLVVGPLDIGGHIQKQLPPWFDGLADGTWNMQMPQIALRLPLMAAGRTSGCMCCKGMFAPLQSASTPHHRHRQGQTEQAATDSNIASRTFQFTCDASKGIHQQLSWH